MEKEIFSKRLININYVRNISIIVHCNSKTTKTFILVKGLFLCRQNNAYLTNRTVNKKIVCSVRDQSFSSKYLEDGSNILSTNEQCKHAW